MFAFNPDGSLKISKSALQAKEENIRKMKTGRCMHATKEFVQMTAPKRCILHLTLSEAITDNRFVENIHNYFTQESTTPTRLVKINEKEFQIEIGTDFRRCTDCCNLVNRYRDFLDGNIIEKKQGCTFEGFRKNFSYEDHFD